MYTREALLGPEGGWAQLIEVRPVKDTAAKGTKFQIWFTGTGKLWLADVARDAILAPIFGRWLHGLYVTGLVEWGAAIGW